MFKENRKQGEKVKIAFQRAATVTRYFHLNDFYIDHSFI